MKPREILIASDLHSRGLERSAPAAASYDITAWIKTIPTPPSSSSHLPLTERSSNRGNKRTNSAPREITSDIETPPKRPRMNSGEPPPPSRRSSRPRSPTKKLWPPPALSTFSQPTPTSPPKSPTKGKGREESSAAAAAADESEPISLPSSVYNPATDISRPPSLSRNSETTRASSPSRKPGELKYLQPGIHFRHPEEGVPDVIASFIAERFNDCLHYIGIVPAALEPSIRSSNSLGLSSLPPYVFGAPSSELSPAKLDRLVQMVLEIHKKARNAAAADVHEGNWVLKVVVPVLQFAVEHLGLKDEIEVEDVQSINISPEDLRPVDNTGTRVPPKRIDCVYALVLTREEDEILDRAFSRLPSHHCSLNQTLSSGLERRPIALNIEVKKQHGDSPLVQLGIWCAAALERQRRGGYDGEGVGALMPGITVVGHHWELWFAYREGEPDKVVLLGPYVIGDTLRHQGIFQLIRALEILTKWATEDHRAWVQDVVLGNLRAVQSS